MDTEGAAEGEITLHLKVERRHVRDGAELIAAMQGATVLRGPSTDVALAVFGTLSVKQIAHTTLLWARDVALLLEARKRPPVLSPDPEQPPGVVEINLLDGTKIRVTLPQRTSSRDEDPASSSVLALLLEHVARATQ